MYVALTRARRRLYLTYAQSRMLHGQTRFNVPSRFFQEIPAELMRKTKAAPRPLAPSYFGGAGLLGKRAGAAASRHGQHRRGAAVAHRAERRAREVRRGRDRHAPKAAAPTRGCRSTSATSGLKWLMLEYANLAPAERDERGAFEADGGRLEAAQAAAPGLPAHAVDREDVLVARVERRQHHRREQPQREVVLAQRHRERHREEHSREARQRRRPSIAGAFFAQAYRLDFIASHRSDRGQIVEVHEQRRSTRAPSAAAARRACRRAARCATALGRLPAPRPRRRAARPPWRHRLGQRRHRLAAERHDEHHHAEIADERDAADRHELRGVRRKPHARCASWSGSPRSSARQPSISPTMKMGIKQDEDDAEQRDEREQLRRCEKQQDDGEPVRRALAKQRIAFGDPGPAVSGADGARLHEADIPRGSRAPARSRCRRL